MTRTEQLLREWLRQDKSPITRQEASRWNLTDNIDRWLYPRIAFGTAGLRAQVGAGYARMNDLIVIQTTQGLARWILRQPTPGQSEKHSVVIGYDGRTNSREFARLAASALLFRDIEVIWLGELVHTPLVAFTVKERQTSAGVMITASHNPKEDNGYKVYAGNGCQINTPVDAEIQAAILEDLEVPDEIWDTANVDTLPKVASDIQKLYVQALNTCIGSIENLPRFVYTPLHGTGYHIFTKVLQAVAKLEKDMLHKIFLPVPEQREADPEFPTVKFPNPEESGALDLAQALAEKSDVSLIVANDPDADRLAIAERIPGGSWYQFKGDEVGTLLGWFIFTKHQRNLTSKPKMFTSAVSSSFLATIGKSEGFVMEETLTGFKWIGNVALAAEKAGQYALFGYEEALGYMIPQICHDKDGVSAAMLFLQATAYWQHESQQTPFQVLQNLYAKYGWIETANTYFKSPSVELTGAIFKSIQEGPRKLLDLLPTGIHVRIRDALAGTDSGEAGGKSRLPVVEGNLMLTFWLSNCSELGDETRITIRASGTEPKVKIYVECKSGESKNVANQGAQRALKAVADTWFRDNRFVIEERWKHIVSI